MSDSTHQPYGIAQFQYVPETDTTCQHMLVLDNNGVLWYREDVRDPWVLSAFCVDLAPARLRGGHDA